MGFAAAFLALAFDGADPYGATTVWQVHVALSAAEFAAMQPDLAAPPDPEKPRPQPADRAVHRNHFGIDLPRAEGAVEIGGARFPHVGIRYKGNGTYLESARSAKRSLRIDLDRFDKSARFRGARTLNLHCGVADPTKCRESVGYALYRAAGVPAPRTALAEVRITVPGKFDRQLLGLYTLVEHVDQEFLRDRFGNPRALALKPNMVRAFAYVGDDWEAYRAAYQPRRTATAAEAARLAAFAKLVTAADDAEFARDIGTLLDVEAYLRFLAATAYIANTDGFFTLGHNYYLVLEPESLRLRFVPWDVDRAFANFTIYGTNAKQLELSFHRPYAGPHRLTERLLAAPGMAERYRTALRELAAGPFSPAWMEREVAALETAMKEPKARDAAAAKARKDDAGSMASFSRPPGLVEFAAKRSAALAAQLAGTSPGFVPAGDGWPAIFRFGSSLAPAALKAIDKNGDRLASRAEWLAAWRKLQGDAGPNAGCLEWSRAIERGLLAAPAPRQPPDDFGLAVRLALGLQQYADANHDRRLSAAELDAAANKLFDDVSRGKPELDRYGVGRALEKIIGPAPFL